MAKVNKRETKITHTQQKYLQRRGKVEMEQQQREPKCGKGKEKKSRTKKSQKKQPEKSMQKKA